LKWSLVIASGVLVAAISGSLLQGQAGTGARVGPEQSEPIAVRSDLVLVPALVRDKSGEPVFTLTADNFVLTDDGVPQRVRLEEDTGGEPLALVVLIEAGAARQSAGWHPETTAAPPNRFEHLPTMIETVVGNVPRKIAVVVFDGHARLQRGFTSEMDAVANALEDASEEESQDGGAAILDGLGFSVDLLRKQPANYRRAILLLSETNDRGSEMPLAQAIRAISDTNTTIFSAAFSTSYADTSRYGHKELPTKRVHDPIHGQSLPHVIVNSSNTYANAASALIGYLTTGVFLENPDPYPAGGCFRKDPDDKSNAAQGKASRTYDCFGQIAPPLALAKMAVIAATDGMRTNVPKTVARMTGGEYFAFNDAGSLERGLATLANHLPNRYFLSFQPHDPHPGMHAIELKLPAFPKLQVTARASYWADSGGTAASAH
jgi:VWFA-related protein